MIQARNFLELSVRNDTMPLCFHCALALTLTQLTCTATHAVRCKCRRWCGGQAKGAGELSEMIPHFYFSEAS